MSFPCPIHNHGSSIFYLEGNVSLSLVLVDSSIHGIAVFLDPFVHHPDFTACPPALGFARHPLPRHSMADMSRY